MIRATRASRSPRALIGLAAVLAGLALTAEAFGQSPPLSPEVAFTYLHRLATHPRCLNCHGTYEGGLRVPTVGDNRVRHPMNISERHNPPKKCSTPEEAARPTPLGAVTCATCHGIVNVPAPGAPPGAPEKPFPWQMPRRAITRLSPDMSKQELCRNWRTAIRESVEHEVQCGTPRMSVTAFFLEHIEHDALIAWVFDPGNGRTKAPGSPKDLQAAARAWAPTLEDDAWCDTIKETQP